MFEDLFPLVNFSPHETRKVTINDEQDCRSSFIAPVQHDLRRFLSQKCNSLSFVPDFREIRRWISLVCRIFFFENFFFHGSKVCE